MAKELNRMNDFFFKYLFGKEQNKPLALSFINAALATEAEYFTDIIYVDKDEDPEHYDGKQVRLDVKGKLNDGKIIELEMQAVNDKYMSERSLYHWARMYGEAITASEDYEELQPSICVNILGFEHLEEKNWRNEYRVLNLESHKELNNHLQLVFLELPKLKVSDIRSMSMLDIWGAYFARKLSDEDLKEVGIMADALKAEVGFTAEQKLRWQYEQREKFLRDQRSREGTARREGREEGREMISKLFALLIKDERLDDLERATTDMEFQNKLIAEYGLE